MNKPEITPEEQHARELILRILEATEDALSSAVLVDRAEEEDTNLDQGAIRRAIWYLIDTGKVEFTPDRLLTEVAVS